MKKFNKKQIEQLKVFWVLQQETSARYQENLHAIEQVMSDSLGIEGLEFFWGENPYIVGIGDVDRTYHLLQEDVLEESPEGRR